MSIASKRKIRRRWQEYEGFVERLVETREKGELTASALSLLCGASRGTIGMVERGVNCNPQAYMLTNIARVLGCDLTWLCHGQGKAPTRAEVRAAIARAQKQVAA